MAEKFGPAKVPAQKNRMGDLKPDRTYPEGVATAAEERDEILHRLRSLVMVLAHNLPPLKAEITTTEGRAIVADLEAAAKEVTRLLCRLVDVV